VGKGRDRMWPHQTISIGAASNGYVVRLLLQFGVRGDAMNLIMALILLLFLASLPTWPYSSGWGFYPSGGFGIVLLILLLMLFTRQRV